MAAAAAARPMRTAMAWKVCLRFILAPMLVEKTETSSCDRAPEPVCAARLRRAV